MCRATPYTQQDIERAKSALLARLANASLSPAERRFLQAQYDYIAANARELPGAMDVGDPEDTGPAADIPAGAKPDNKA